jgi:hypothetical protein
MILDYQYKLKTFLNIAVKDHRVGAWDILLKIVYMALQLLDLEMTLIALQLGFPELNPFIRALLIPGIALLAGIIGWNMKELLVLLF